MGAVINNTKWIRRVNIFCASDFSVLCLRRGFSLQKHVAAYCLHRRTVSCDDNIRVLGKGTEILSSFPH